MQIILPVERRMRCGSCVFNSKLFNKIRCQEIIFGRNDYVVLKGIFLLNDWLILNNIDQSFNIK